MTALQAKLAANQQAQKVSSLLLVAWRERRRNPRQMLAVSTAVGRALGHTRPATYDEMQQWYCDFGVTRDRELLESMGVAG